jgi:hypothetical protein
MPSRDVAADLRIFSEGLGAEVVFAIEAFGTRVAMLRLAEGPPELLLAGHLEGERPVLVYRVDDLDVTVAELARRGVDAGPRLGIPHGPLHSFSLEGGQRVGLYELTRPGAPEQLAGRRDF